jgi:hypothetical protein
MKQIRETKTVQRQPRGFNLMPVGHEGEPLACPAGLPQEIAAGIFLTVDAASGSALIEINPQEKRISVAVDGKEIMDVAQLARGSVLTLDGRDYAFLKYMDVYFNPASMPIPMQRVTSPARILPLTAARPEPVVPAPVRRPSGRMVARLALPAVLVAAAAAALLILPEKQIPVSPGGKKTEQIAGKPAARPRKPAPAPAVNAPETLRDLMADETVPAAPAPAKTAEPTAIPAEKQAAIPIKPEPAKQVKPEARPQQVARPTARPAVAPAPVQPALSAEMQKALNREYEEAVLIRGYDRDRSVQILEKLRTKVPAGSALHKKIETALKG